jgi:hypothetical protein
MNITSLGEARFASPIQHPVSDKERIPANIVRDPDETDCPIYEHIDFRFRRHIDAI